MEQLRVQFTGSSEHDVNETEHEHQHSIQSLIDELILANSISTSHISSQILIGNLFFKEKGRRDLAEIWLTKACEEKNETFITPLYENRKSYAWRKLAHVLDVTGRQEKAQKCILKALAVSNQHPVLWKLRTGLFDAI